MTDATTAAATTTAATTATTTTTADPPAFDWTKSGIDGDSLAWTQNKGFKTIGDAVTSHRNLEKLMGGGLDKIIQIPGADADANAWNGVYDKLGRPKEAKGYDIPMPQGGGDEKLAEWFRGTAHEIGLSVRQTKALVEKWNGHMGGLTKAQTQALADKHAGEIDGLRKEWGSNFDAHTQIVDRAAEAFGMTEQHLSALKSAMGPAGAMKFLHAIGSKLGTDDTFVSGGNRNPGGFGGMTPQQAHAAIEEKRRDTAFIQKYAAGDAEARREMERLHRIAYPDG